MVQEKGQLMRASVLYIGSGVPLDFKDGLEAVQKPLADRYKVQEKEELQGILSDITVVQDGITLQYHSDLGRILFFTIASLKMCAAVRCVTTGPPDPKTGKQGMRFLSLTDPAARSQRPAIFTFITRRTEGRKVLECHSFICSSDMDALNLVTATSSISRQYKERHGVEPSPAPTPGFDTARSSFTSVSAPATAPAIANGGAGGGSSGDGENHAIRLVAGGDSGSRRRVASEFYDPPPEGGYFYKTEGSQIRTYTVERVVEEGGGERIRAYYPHAPPPPQASGPVPVAMPTTLPRGGPVPERRPVYAVPPPPHPGMMTMPPHMAQGRPMIPVRMVPAPPGGPGGRPRFFSPPPTIMRSAPPPGMPPGRYMMGPEPYILMPAGSFMQPPFVVMDPQQLSPRRRGSHSSRGSSGSSSPGGSPRQNGQREASGGVNGDGGSSDDGGGSRPHTPPTDYERRGGGPRVSRKEQFERTQQHQHQQRQYLRQANPNTDMPYGAPPMTPHPYGMFMMYPPQQLHYPGYPTGMERARSVPPSPGRRGLYQENGKKSKKSKDKKGKKSKKGKHSKKNGTAPSDVSTDSVGYTSEIGPPGAMGDYPRMPRDFRLFDNQFKHERAFGKSLKQEGTAPASGANPGNAYSLNEHMSKKSSGGGGDRGEADFPMY